MRVSFLSLLSVAGALSSYLVAAHPDSFQFEARDYVDGLSARDLEIAESILERRDLLADISTRELVDELSDRLQRRGNSISKPKKYGCPYCGTKYATEKEAKDCATLPQMLGGCKPNDRVAQGKKPGKK